MSSTETHTRLPRLDEDPYADSRNISLSPDTDRRAAQESARYVRWATIGAIAAAGLLLLKPSLRHDVEKNLGLRADKQEVDAYLAHEAETNPSVVSITPDNTNPSIDHVVYRFRPNHVNEWSIANEIAPHEVTGQAVYDLEGYMSGPYAVGQTVEFDVNADDGTIVPSATTK